MPRSNDLPPPGFHWLDEPMPAPAASDTVLPTYSPENNVSEPMVPITDTLGKLHGGVSGAISATGLPKPVGEFVADLAVPVTPTDIGIWVATLPFKGATVGTKLLSRLPATAAKVLAPTIGGMIGGAYGESGSTSTSGAMHGLLAGATGATFEKMGKMLTYFPWIQDIAKRDTENVGNAIADMVPEFGNIKSLKDFQRTFLRTYGQKSLSGKYDQTLGEISDALAGQPVNAPTMIQYAGSKSNIITPTVISNLKSKQTPLDVPFQVAMDKIKTLRNEGQRLINSGAGPQGAEKMAIADAIESEVTSSLPPELGQKLLEAKQSYAKGKSFLRFFDDPKLITNDGLNMELIQKKFRSEGLSASEAAISAGELAKFEQALFRGGDSLVVDELPDYLQHMRAHKFGVGISIPLESISEKRFVGNLPQRGGAAYNALSPLTPYLGGRAIGRLSKPITLGKDDDSE